MRRLYCRQTGNQGGRRQVSHRQEGTQKKFLNDVEQIAFSGKYSYSFSQEVAYITERAVFVNTKDGLMLTEIAPGVDLEKEVLAQMEFKPIISPDLKLMPEGIFKPVWGELKQIISNKSGNGS